MMNSRKKTLAVTPRTCWKQCAVLELLCGQRSTGYQRTNPSIFSWTMPAVMEYTEELLTRFNIVLIHQVARSCETNTLDLGIWMTLQAAVERVHCLRCADNDALFRSVQETWDTIDQTQAFSNVWG
jgi:hypothetical protein